MSHDSYNVTSSNSTSRDSFKKNLGKGGFQNWFQKISEIFKPENLIAELFSTEKEAYI